MSHINYYASKVNRTLRHGQIPDLSHAVDSFRAYQWELVFHVPQGVNNIGFPLTLAAKQVSPIGGTSEDIVVDRVNDKFYYPGKVSFDEMTVTFDDLYNRDVASELFNWWQTIYDAETGEFTKNFTVGTGGTFKTNAQLYQLDNKMEVFKHIHLYGLYPKSWRASEKNYATNEFATIEVLFRYDFAVMEPRANLHP